MNLFSLIAVILFFPLLARAEAISLSLQEAERQGLHSSNQLRADGSTVEAAREHAGTQFSSLLPRLTIDGYYQYNTHVPELTLAIPNAAPIPFGSHDSYSVGPTLSYTLLDWGASSDSFHAAETLASAQEENRKGRELSILQAVRGAYLKLQLSLEELRLLNDTLNLSRAQNQDISMNYKGGAATKLDWVDSQRDVLNYQLQFQQKQAEVGSDLRDLEALVGIPYSAAGFHPGPPGIPAVDLVLSLDSLGQSLDAAAAWSFAPTSDSHPLLKGPALEEEAARNSASGAKALLYPKLQIQASAKWMYPDEVNLNEVEQNSFLISLSLPIFDGNYSRHLAAEAGKQAEAAGFKKEQERNDLGRDFSKCMEEMSSLKEQKLLSAEDVARSEEAARLYYKSYRGGKINLIDVQSANNRALVAKVNEARVNAALLAQIYNLRAISGGGE